MGQALVKRDRPEFMIVHKGIKHQKRRAQTEARIGIFKNSILDGSLYERNIENKQMKVAWAVLAHNLWCIARLPQLTGSNTEAA